GGGSGCVVCGGGYAYMRWAMDGVADLGVSGCGPVATGRQRENERETAYQDGAMAVGLVACGFDSEAALKASTSIDGLRERGCSVRRLRV
ncbi:unnamed protein product, partial [Ilex paraguariensis]